MTAVPTLATKLLTAAKPKKQLPLDPNPAPIADGEANALLYGRELGGWTWSPKEEKPAAWPAVTTGTLQHAAGGYTGDDQLPVRVSAVLGPGASLVGVARSISGLVNSAPAPSGSVPALGDVVVAQALYVYNQDFLAGFDDVWKVGLRLVLPLEMDLGADPVNDPALQGLVTDRDKLLDLSTAFPASASNLLQPKDGAARLPIPDPGRLAADVTAELGGSPDGAAVAETYLPRIVMNPYDVVFRIVEIMRQLTALDIDKATDFVLGLGANMHPEQARFVGWTTAGNAILRRLWGHLEPASGALVVTPTQQADVDASKFAFAAGLGLVQRGTATPPTDWFGPLEVGPALFDKPELAPVEPPMTAVQRSTGKALTAISKLTGEDPCGLHEMALGRDMCVGKLDTYQSYTGPAYAGRLTVPAYVQARPQSIGTSTPKKQACLNAVVAISPSEGMLDASRAADSGQLSSGIHQWTSHNNDELTVLWWKFRQAAPDHYDLHFGRVGVQPEKWAPDGSHELADPPADAKVDAANPHARTQAGGAAPQPSDYGDDFPSFVALLRLAPGQARAILSSTSSDRVKFFDGHPTSGGARYDGYWCARARLAALTSYEYCDAQIQTAVYRFQRLLDDWTKTTWKVEPAGTSHPDQHTLQDIFSSEVGAAAVIDSHINERFIPHTNTRAIDHDVPIALARSFSVNVDPYDGGASLTDEYRVRLVIDYMAVRSTTDTGNRNKTIVSRYDGGLNSIPGTFKGW